jgi:hypothetical protein
MDQAENTRTIGAGWEEKHDTLQQVSTSFNRYVYLNETVIELCANFLLEDFEALPEVILESLLSIVLCTSPHSANHFRLLFTQIFSRTPYHFPFTGSSIQSTTTHTMSLTLSPIAECRSPKGSL